MRVKVSPALVYLSLIVVTLFCASLSHAEIPVENLAGAWLFNEGAGDTVKDSSGNGNHGTIAGGEPQWVDSEIGMSMEFDGVDDYIEIPDSESLGVGVDDFTLVAWLNPASPGGGNGIICKGAWCWNGGWILDIGDTGAGAIRLESSANGGNNGSIITPGGTMTVGEWQFIAVSITRGEDSFIYRNGEEVGVAVVQANDLTHPEYSLLMGCLLECNKQPAAFFDVSISQVALFTGVALTLEETNEIMDEGLVNILAVSSEGKLTTTWANVKIQD